MRPIQADLPSRSDFRPTKSTNIKLQFLQLEMHYLSQLRETVAHLQSHSHSLISKKDLQVKPIAIIPQKARKNSFSSAKGISITHPLEQKQNKNTQPILQPFQQAILQINQDIQKEIHQLKQTIHQSIRSSSPEEEKNIEISYGTKIEELNQKIVQSEANVQEAENIKKQGELSLSELRTTQIQFRLVKEAKIIEKFLKIQSTVRSLYEYSQKLLTQVRLKIRRQLGDAALELKDKSPSIKTDLFEEKERNQLICLGMMAKKNLELSLLKNKLKKIKNKNSELILKNQMIGESLEQSEKIKVCQFMKDQPKHGDHNDFEEAIMQIILQHEIFCKLYSQSMEQRNFRDLAREKLFEVKPQLKIKFQNKIQEWSHPIVQQPLSKAKSPKRSTLKDAIKLKEGEKKSEKTHLRNDSRTMGSFQSNN